MRIRIAIAAAAVAACSATGVIVLTGSADATSSAKSASANSLVGKWKGYLTTTGERVPFQVSVSKNEKTGTWRMSPTCAGTLRLKDISGGYHHYYRVAGQNRGCAPAGIDCLKRVGSGMLDWFNESTGNISFDGTLRRVS
jgi:hypothetical protein